MKTFNVCEPFPAGCVYPYRKFGQEGYKTMTINVKQKMAAGAAALMTMTALAATAAPASADVFGDLFGKNKNHSVQTDKNNMRNLGIGLGAVAAYELLNGKTGAGVLLGAGAAYAAKKYNDDRKEQSQNNRDWERYRYQHEREHDYRNRDHR